MGHLSINHFLEFIELCLYGIVSFLFRGKAVINVSALKAPAIEVSEKSSI